MSIDPAAPADLGPHRDRFAFLDALRGLAAVAVLAHHLYVGELQVPLSQVFPAVLGRALTAGIQGFHVFFVISGFVIAHALRDAVVTLGSGTRFLARRLVRLTPAYWVVLVPYVIVRCLAAWHHAYDERHQMPTVGEVLANALYLQEVLSHRRVWNFVTVAWTLCLEVQFYACFVALLWIGQRMSRRRPAGSAPALVVITTIASFAVESWRIRTGGPAHLAQTWIIYPGSAFGLGALAYWCGDVPARSASFAAVAAGVAGLGLWTRRWDLLVPGSTACAISLLAVGDRLRRVTLGRAVQYFGTISYSLYLVHMLVLARVFRAGVHLTGLRQGPAVLWFCIGAVASVAVAHGFYLLVERPTRRLAARLKVGPEPAPSLAPATAATGAA